MNPSEVKKLEDHITRLEKLALANIKQERDRDWVDNSRIVKKLDTIAENEPSIPKQEADF